MSAEEVSEIINPEISTIKDAARTIGRALMNLEEAHVELAMSRLHGAFLTTNPDWNTIWGRFIVNIIGGPDKELPPSIRTPEFVGALKAVEGTVNRTPLTIRKHLFEDFRRIVSRHRI